MKKIFLTLAISSIAMSCASSNTFVKELPVESSVQLTTNDVEILGDTKGTAQQTTVLGGMISMGDMGLRISLPLFGTLVNTLSDKFQGGPASTLQAEAYQKAMNNATGADGLLLPRVKRDSFSIPLLFSQESVSVKAKAIRVKAK